jgi:hypothetical protein
VAELTDAPSSPAPNDSSVTQPNASCDTATADNDSYGAVVTNPVLETDLRALLEKPFLVFT